MDTLANAMNSLKLAEAKGKRSVRVKVISKLVKGVLELLKENDYLNSVEEDTGSRHPRIVAELAGRITDCGVIKPRYAVKADEIDDYEQRVLPAQGVGLLILSTPKGLMTNIQAKEANQGGRLLAYVY